MKYLISCISIVPIALATIIYIAFRNTNFLINDIFAMLIGSFNIEQFSEFVQDCFMLSSINVNSLPSALWVFSTAFLSTRSNFKSKAIWYVWISLPLCYSIVLEGLQLLNLTDGTYDSVDILYSLIGWVLAMIVAKFIDIKAKGCAIPYPYLAILYLALTLGNVW